MDATTTEAFNGLRVELPNGKLLVTRTPLGFRTAVRWMELLDRYNAGEPFTTTLKLILEEMPTALAIEDMGVLEDLTLGEVIDFAVYRFFSHRRATPPWSPAYRPPTPAPASP